MTCDRCLNGRHVRCADRQHCTCSICATSKPKAPPRRKTPAVVHRPSAAPSRPRVHADRRAYKTAKQATYRAAAAQHRLPEHLDGLSDVELVLAMLTRLAEGVEAGRLAMPAPAPERCRTCGQEVAA